MAYPDPPAPLTVASAGRFAPYTGNGFGDFYIGDGDIGFSIGVATAGGGRGVTRLWTNGGEDRIKLGSAEFGDVLTVVGDRVGVRTGNGMPGNDLDVNGDVRVRSLEHIHPVNIDVRVQPDGDLVVESPIRYMSIPATAFHRAVFDPAGFNPGYTRTLQNGYSMELTFGNSEANAPVTLPDGALLEGMVLYAMDNAESSDLVVDLIRCLHLSRGFSECTNVAGITTSGASPNPRAFATFSVAPPVIDNEFYRYSVRAYGSGGWGIDAMRLLSVRLQYLD